VTSDRALARYVRRSVYAYSDYYRDVFDRAGLSAGRIGGRDGLKRVPPTDLAGVADPGTLVLRPDLGRIMRYGDRGLAARIVAARLLGGLNRFNTVVFEPRFKPVQWLMCAGVPVGYSSADLLHLGRIGADMLDRAGVTRGDVVVSLLPPGPTVAHWQLVQGTRRARVSAVHLGPGPSPRLVASLGPSVLVGHFEDVRALLASGLQLPNLRTVLCVGGATAPTMAELVALSELAGMAPVVAAWAPPGARVMWAECRAAVEGGRDEGLWFHVASDSEVVEVTDNGELLWTGVGWYGSALLRVRTGRGAPLAEGCLLCGRPGQLVRATGSLAAVLLEAEAEVVSYDLEERTVDGQPELIVRLAVANGTDAASVIERLEPRLHATQYVVLDGATMVGPGREAT
jgi:hypothetical protein